MNRISGRRRRGIVFAAIVSSMVYLTGGAAHGDARVRVALGALPERWELNGHCDGQGLRAKGLEVTEEDVSHKLPPVPVPLIPLPPRFRVPVSIHTAPGPSESGVEYPTIDAAVSGAGYGCGPGPNPPPDDDECSRIPPPPSPPLPFVWVTHGSAGVSEVGSWAAYFEARGIPISIMGLTPWPCPSPSDDLLRLDDALASMRDGCGDDATGIEEIDLTQLDGVVIPLMPSGTLPDTLTGGDVLANWHLLGCE